MTVGLGIKDGLLLVALTVTFCTWPPPAEIPWRLIVWSPRRLEPVIVTVGVEVKPAPGVRTLMAVTTPLVSTAAAVAPLPPPPEIVTVGGVV